MASQQQNQGTNKQIVVIGMHRSGTSMIAGVLYYLGIFMGEQLMIDDPETGPTLEQPHGYYEDREFMGINTNILTEAGGGWENVPDRGQLLLACETGNSELDKLIKKRNRSHITWGFKDPRTSLTLPAYLCRLQNPKVILIVRDRDDTIASLLKREKWLTFNKANELYDDYYHHIWSNLNDRNVDYLVTSFGGMIKNPKHRIERIVEYLGLKISTDQYQKALAHIRPNIRARGRP